jgi:DNA repair protein RadC
MDGLNQENNAGAGKPENPAKFSHSGKGHRKRLAERFTENGLGALHLHEIVELILTYAIPRRDTKGVAKDLIKRYKTLNGLLNADGDDLARTTGIGQRSATLLLLMREVMARCLREKYEQKSIISHRRDAEEYLRFHYGHRRDEFVAALFLGNRNQILETDIIAEGTVNQCVVYPRLIMEKALRFGAASIILAHNHPGGGIKPSEADWLLTERLFTICKLLEIPLLDHLIISQMEVVSLKELPRWPVSGGR